LAAHKYKNTKTSLLSILNGDSTVKASEFCCIPFYQRLIVLRETADVDNVRFDDANEALVFDMPTMKLVIDRCPICGSTFHRDGGD